MGQAAAEASDFVVLTSDNPRSEDPLAIMNDALVGIRRKDVPHIDRAGPCRGHRARYQRGAARAISSILAGKGHETYQILKDWHDRISTTAKWREKCFTVMATGWRRMNLSLSQDAE